MRNDLLLVSFVRGSRSLPRSFVCLALSPCLPFCLPHDLHLHVCLLKGMRMTARALLHRPPLKTEDYSSFTFSLSLLLYRLASRFQATHPSFDIFPSLLRYGIFLTITQSVARPQRQVPGPGN